MFRVFQTGQQLLFRRLPPLSTQTSKGAILATFRKIVGNKFDSPPPIKPSKNPDLPDMAELFEKYHDQFPSATQFAIGMSILSKPQ